jgi:hypothetical protein
MRRRLPRALLLPLLLLTAACAGARSSTSVLSPPGDGEGGTAGGVRHISWAEIEATADDALTAWDLIQRLRPAMLRPRAFSLRGRGGGGVSVVAYLDNVRLTDLRSLQNVWREQVYEIRYVSASDATTRWGTGHASGAILVITRR